jgi:hypothetical protein
MLGHELNLPAICQGQFNTLSGPRRGDVGGLWAPRGGLAWVTETGVEARSMTFRVGVFGMTSRVMGLGVLVATAVHAQAVAPTPGAPELPSCRERVRRAARDSGLEESRRNLPHTPRECLTARLLLHASTGSGTSLIPVSVKRPGRRL